MTTPVRLVLALAAAVAFVACDPTAQVEIPETVVDDRTVTFDELRAAVAVVARAQSGADDGINRALEATRAVDRSVAALLDPERIDAQVDRWPDVAATAEGAPLTGHRDAYIEVALAADRARSALSRARSRASGSWEQDYLDAEDDVLLAVRAYAEEADRVAQLLERHAGTYEAVVARNGDFVERRGFFRSPEEASDAYATEIDGQIRDLATAQRELSSQVDAWRAAGVEVNDTAATANRILEERPTESEG